MGNTCEVRRSQRKQIYNMIDGLKNNAAPKEKKNRPKESILAKLNEKKEEVARRSGQKAMQQVMGQDMERKKN